MKVDVLLGLQWGDEGKGKVVDYLAPKYPLVARFQGGPNAGHTLEFDGIKHVLHQIPSGVFRAGTRNIIGNGVVLDPVVFKREVEGLAQYKVPVQENLFISKKTTLILPTHRLLDAAYENAKGEAKIGSTLRGIGPAYADKIARQGLRVGDILSDNFKQRYEELREKHLSLLAYLDEKPDMKEAEAVFFDAIEFLRGMQLADTEYMIDEAIGNNQRVLAEGAQGSLLDVDFGSYPFVTSSTTTAAGACTGLGLAPRQIGEVFGIFKAYCTRVGSGPFPTELHDETGEKLRAAGREFGATTGRPRRCGWLDLPALRYAIMLNGVSQLFMMKADVLNSFEEIKVCTHYRLADGSLTDQLPYDLAHTEVEPVYESLKGWNQSLEDVSSYESLPQALLDYVAYLEEHLKVPVNVVSVGPDRKETLVRTPILV
jgi:adenylosuccinate synthase